MPLWQQWLHHPEKARVRNAFFQLHLWAGAGAAAYILLMSISGIVIVYRNELSRKFSVEWVVNLHANLLFGPTGRLVNGIGAICLTSLCLTGAIIWWPGVKNWRRSLTVNGERTLRGSPGIFTVRSDSGAFSLFCCGGSLGSIFRSHKLLMLSSCSITILPIRVCSGFPSCILEGSAGLRKLSGPLQDWYPQCWRSRVLSFAAAG